MPIANEDRLVLPLPDEVARCLNFAAPHLRLRCGGAAAARRYGHLTGQRSIVAACRTRGAPGEQVWRQLANDPSARIADGTYPLGSALPAEDELARQYAVARSAARRALDELRKRKLIKTLQGLKRGGRRAGAGVPAG